MENLNKTINILGNYVYYPKLNFIIKLINNKEINLPHFYMKYVVLFGMLLALKLFVRYSCRLLKILKNNLKLTLPLKPVGSNNKWTVILGFGDNENSVTIAKYFASRGFNLLMLISPQVLKVRKEYNLNEIQKIDSLTNVKLLEYDYESFITAYDFDIGEFGVIEYVFDTSVLRLYNNELTKEEKSTHLNSFFYNDSICKWTNIYMAVMDKLKLYFSIRSELNPVKIFMFNYPDKNDEVNHKMFYEFRKSIYIQYQEIFKKTVVFNIIKYFNEFRGYYIKNSQLKSLEILKFNNNDSEINFI